VTKTVRRGADRHADQSMTVPFRMRQIRQLCIGHRTLNLPTATAPNRSRASLGRPGSTSATADFNGEQTDQRMLL
jgi:hypothetical protein